MKETTPLRRAGVRVRRACRKHRVALLALGVFHLVLFFPLIFMGRLLSPNDIYFAFDPWRSLADVRVQNPLLNDPSTSYYTVASLMHDLTAFHWNPFIGSGVPGWGSAAAISPFIVIPALLLPLPLFYVGVVLLKINVAFAGAYWWLREEHLGKRAAAFGALVISAAGAYAVWWLWQGSNATALYPLTLLLIARMLRRRFVPFVAMVLLAIAYLLAGFPAAVAYGGYLSVFYLVARSLQARFVPWRDLVRATVALIVAGAITAPFVVTFVGFVRRTGYLGVRADIASAYSFPLSHLRGLIQPFYLGDPAAHQWIGDPQMRNVDNLVESTIYFGAVALPFVIAGLFLRRARHRWFFALFTIGVVVAITSGDSAVGKAIGELPGIRFSALTRLRVLLPIGAGYLAAAGLATLLRWKPIRRRALKISLLLVVLLASDLALFAGRFFPFVPWKLAHPPQSAIVTRVREEKRPTRIAPMFDLLWPNTSELVRVEDIRTHFSAEARYRDLLRRLDPAVSSSSSTVLQFNSLAFQTSDPLLSMLNVRYVLEQPSIDILRWKTIENTVAVGSAAREVELRSGGELRREITIPDSSVTAVEVSLRLLESQPDGWVELELKAKDAVVARRRWLASEIPGGKLYLPTRGIETNGPLTLRIVASGSTIALPASDADPFVYGLVRYPLYPVSELVDGRIFENANVIERFWPIWQARLMTFDELLADRSFDFATTAAIESQHAGIEALPLVPREARVAEVKVVSYASSKIVLQTRSDVPFFLASSEKNSPELEVTIDGGRAEVVTINGVFAGTTVSSGSHSIVFSRRIGRGLWPVSAAGLLLFAVAAFVERRYVRGRASTMN